MKRFTISICTLVVSLGLSVNLSANDEQIAFWDYNMFSGTAGELYPDVAITQAQGMYVMAINDRSQTEGLITPRTLRVASTSGFEGTPCMRSDNWDPIADGIKYWLFEGLNVEGYTDIKFSSYIYSTSSATNKGPQAFRFDYKLSDEGEWKSVGDFQIIDKGAFGENPYSWTLPTECNGCKTLFIRLVSNDKSIDDGVSASTKNALNGLDNTLISGVKIPNGVIESTTTKKDFSQHGNQIQFLNSIKAGCTIYTVCGQKIMEQAVVNGDSYTFNKQGVYIINLDGAIYKIAVK